MVVCPWSPSCEVQKRTSTCTPADAPPGGKISGKDYLRWFEDDCDPEKQTIRALIKDARAQCKSVLERGGYTRAQINQIVSTGASVTDVSRKRNERIKGSTGGFEAACATRCLHLCLFFEYAVSRKNWEKATRYAFHVGEALGRLYYREYAAHPYRRGQEKQAEGKRNVTANFIKAAQIVQEGLIATGRRPPTKKEIWHATKSKPPIEYSTFCAHFPK